MKFYISFGQSHVHRIDGKIFDRDCLCEVEAQSEDAARDIAFKAFGAKWGTIYEALEGHIEHFPRGPIALEL